MTSSKMSSAKILKPFVLVVAAVIIGMLSSGCANENSAQQVNREKLDRERARNQTATGTYSGYLVKRGTGARVPFSMDVVIVENTTNSTAGLQASLTVGLFGGVTVTTGQAGVLYNNVNGELDVFFSQSGSPGGGGSDPGAAGRSAGGSGGEGNTVRIHATVQNRLITNGTLRGSKSGMFDFDTRTSDTQFNTDTDIQLITVFKGQRGGRSRALVTLTHRLDPQPSKAGMDLPQLPPLASTLQFESLGDAPLAFSQTLYDPLKGEIEFDFQNNNRLILRNVYLPSNSAKTEISHLDGTLYQGGTKRADVSADVFKGQNNIATQPPTNYVGTLMTPQGLSTKVVATVVSQGQVLNNPGNSIFPLFPALDLQIVACGAVAKLPFHLIRIEQVEGVATFSSTNPLRNYTLDASVPSDWSSISGYVISTRQDSTVRLKLNLKATNNPGSCQ